MRQNVRLTVEPTRISDDGAGEMPPALGFSGHQVARGAANSGRFLLAREGRRGYWSNRPKGLAVTFTITHLSGADERGVAPVSFGPLLDELANADDEHPDVAIQHESGWCLSIGRSGVVTVENVEEGGPVHQPGLARREILELMELVAAGRVEEVLELPGWQDGYSTK